MRDPTGVDSALEGLAYAVARRASMPCRIQGPVFSRWDARIREPVVAVLASQQTAPPPDGALLHALAGFSPANIFRAIDRALLGVAR